MTSSSAPIGVAASRPMRLHLRSTLDSTTKKLPPSWDHAKRIIESLVFFVCKDLCVADLCMVENPGFRHMVNTVRS